WWLVAAVVVDVGGGVGCGWGGDEDDGDGVHGSRVVMMMYAWWRQRRWRRRVVASGVVDLVDRGGRSVFGIRRKSFPAVAS
nr:hypothetical protein [Tanacetum cinerariifolium]